MAEVASSTGRIILASASPRRLELLARLGLEPLVRPADVDETIFTDEAAEPYVARLARIKAEAVAGGTDTAADDLIVAADTVVVLGGVTSGDVLGKPTGPADAASMLRRLSGATHHVLTGVHLVRGDRAASAVETTEVLFRTIIDAEIEAYVATGEPLDKAGAYAIQGAGGMFVEGIVGSDTNVIGLPLATVVTLAAELDVTLLPR